MSAQGHSRRRQPRSSVCALPLLSRKLTSFRCLGNRRFVPISDSCTASKVYARPSGVGCLCRPQFRDRTDESCLLAAPALSAMTSHMSCDLTPSLCGRKRCGALIAVELLGSSHCTARVKAFAYALSDIFRNAVAENRKAIIGVETDQPWLARVGLL